MHNTIQEPSGSQTDYTYTVYVISHQSSVIGQFRDHTSPPVPSRRFAPRRDGCLPRGSLRSPLGTPQRGRFAPAQLCSARYARLTRTRRSATRLQGLRAHSHQLPSLMARNYPRLARVAAGILGSVPPWERLRVGTIRSSRSLPSSNQHRSTGLTNRAFHVQTSTVDATGFFVSSAT